jgi:hypothetical protein
MPRYYFHIRQGDKTIQDDEGMECANLEAVREEALQSAREIMSEALRSGGLGENRTFVIEDSKGDTVHELPFQTAIAQ